MGVKRDLSRGHWRDRRYTGLITPSPNPIGVIGDFLCSALNQNVGAFSIGPAAVAIECRTIRWLTDLVGYGPAAGGNLTSGAIMANFIGLKLARDWTSGYRAQHDAHSRNAWPSIFRKSGTCPSIPSASAEHLSGCFPPIRNFRFVSMPLNPPSTRIAKRGIRPMCLIGIFGTTSTGAIDPIRDLYYCGP